MATSVPTKVRGVLWTLYNYEPHLDDLREYGKAECDYMVYGFEICPTTGNPHLQGYLYWKNPRAYPNKALRKLFPGIHDMVANGSAEDNRRYCLKLRPGDVPNERYEEIGIKPVQGQRTDWARAITQIQQGSTVPDIIVEQPHIAPCVRALLTVKQMMVKSTHREINVIVLIGPPGSGKSKWAYDNYPNLFSKPNGDWWDGYQGETTVLLDDFYGDIKYPLLLKVCDRYPLQVQIKGGFVPANWDTIIITSNEHPDTWYPSVPNIHAFNRRVKNFWIDNIPPNNANEEELPQAS